MGLSTHIRFCFGHVEVPKSSFRYILGSMLNLWEYSQTDQTLIRKHTNCLFFLLLLFLQYQWRKSFLSSFFKLLQV